MARCPWILVALLLLSPAASFADPINPVNIGFISFDILIPGGSGTGVNVFNIMNFTGDPLSGGLGLPPEFIVSDALTFLGSSLTLVSSQGATSVITLGDIGPGGLSIGQSFLVQFPETDLFSSVIFTATLSQTSFFLFDGTPFTAASSVFSAQLLALPGLTLTPGTDLALLTISSAEVAPIPEPGTVVLLGTGLVALIAMKTRSRRNSRPQCSNAPWY